MIASYQLVEVVAFCSAVVIQWLCLAAAHHSTRATPAPITFAYVLIFGGSASTLFELYDGSHLADWSSTLIQVGVALLLSISRRRSEKGFPPGHMQPFKDERRVYERRSRPSANDESPNKSLV